MFARPPPSYLKEMTVWKVPKAVGDVKNSGPGLCVELSKPELFSPSPFGRKVKRWTLERDDDGRDWEPFWTSILILVAVSVVTDIA